MPPKQTRQETLEKKRLVERRRLQKIRNDPELYAQWQEKQRQKYLIKKRSGKIIPVGEMSPQQQKLARQKSRESSRRYNQKKKLKSLQEHEEYIIYRDDEDLKINSDDNKDPLGLNQPHSSNFLAIEPRFLSSPMTDISTTSSRITRSGRRKIIDQSSIRQPGLSLELTPLRDTDTLLSDIDTPLSDIDTLLSDIDTPSPRSSETSSCRSSLSDITSEVTPNPVQSLSKKQKQEKAIQKTSSWKHLLRKTEYMLDKKLLRKEKRIQDLKSINEKYRQQIKILKKSKTGRKPVETLSVSQKSSKKEDLNDSTEKAIDTSNTNIKVEIFFEEDGSTLCPVKKEYNET